MIAGMLPAPHRAIDSGSDQPIGNRPAQQQMIDAQPGIAGKRVPEIFPEGVGLPAGSFSLSNQRSMSSNFGPGAGLPFGS